MDNVETYNKSAEGIEYGAYGIPRQGEGFVCRYFTVTQNYQEEITEWLCTVATVRIGNSVHWYSDSEDASHIQ